MMDKDKILATLRGMLPDALDRMRDDLQVEQLEAIGDYAKARDEELTMRYEKRKALLVDNSVSKAENMLRADEELYLKKKLIIALGTKKKEIAIRLNLVESFFWKNK